MQVVEYTKNSKLLNLDMWYAMTQWKYLKYHRLHRSEIIIYITCLITTLFIALLCIIPTGVRMCHRMTSLQTTKMELIYYTTNIFRQSCHINVAHKAVFFRNTKYWSCNPIHIKHNMPLVEWPILCIYLFFIGLKAVKPQNIACINCPFWKNRCLACSISWN